MPFKALTARHRVWNAAEAQLRPTVWRRLLCVHSAVPRQTAQGLGARKHIQDFVASLQTSAVAHFHKFLSVQPNPRAGRGFMLFDDKPRLARCFKQRDLVSSVGDGYKYLTLQC